MDGSALEHSDSDSGESWTLLESGPLYADDAPAFADHPLREDGLPADIADKDEDTDGISIISDSDPESSAPCDLGFDNTLLEEGRPAEPQLPDFVSVNPVPPNSHEQHESIRDDEDFLGDRNGKLKTYVHKRNKRLSTMLNIIVLGSVITAAGVAIGHMWGARNDCALHAGPSVNKILSNLYKLQEENAFLRNRVKELTLVNNFQQMQRKSESEKPPLKQHKCRKVFEESLTNKNADRLTKCVDNESEKFLENNMMEFEKEFLSDIEKLRNVYHENKSWLDEEIARRMKREGQFANKFKINHLKSPKSIRINEDLKTLKDERVHGQTAAEPPLNAEQIINVTEPLASTVQTIEVQKETIPEKKVTYADSLKSDHKVIKRDINQLNTDNNKLRDHIIKKKKPRKEFETITEISSDEELKKDDRYVPHMYKPERKKNDRHKANKKLKRRNKYEQWEMKGGYMKDYDDFSISSTHENEFVSKNADKNHLSKEFERNNYINQFSEPVDLKKVEVVEGKEKTENRSEANRKGEKGRGKDSGWYSQRAALRSEARRKLEQELFGGAAPAPAQWYFRRVQRREQCRAKRDRDAAAARRKRQDNYKTKH